MTEDDTFLALKRIPFKKMHELMKTDAPKWNGEWDELLVMLDAFMKPYGWTYYEYYSESMKKL